MNHPDPAEHEKLKCDFAFFFISNRLLEAEMMAHSCAEESSVFCRDSLATANVI
jgi:hypothetical protein